MFGIGGVELLLILLFGFLVFGPDKLPEMAKTLGKAIAKFRQAQDDMKSTLSGQSFVDKESGELKNPLDVLENAANDVQKKTSAAQKKVDAGVDKVVEKTAEKTESFAERKARYDRERAARKAEEAAAAKAAENDSAQNAEGVTGATSSADDATAPADAASASAKPASTSADISKKVATPAAADDVQSSATNVASEKQE